MKKFTLSIILLIVSFVSYAQSFEGVLTYKAKYEFSGFFDSIKDDMIKKMKDDGIYYDTLKLYIKGNKYLKKVNKNKPLSILYSPIRNKIYYTNSEDKLVTIIDAKNFNSVNIDYSAPIISKVDTIRNIAGFPCKALKLSWPEIGDGWFFYNSKIAPLNPSLYKDHNFEYLNLVLEETNSYPLEIVQTSGSFMVIRLTLIKIEEIEISEDIFHIPPLKKVSKKQRKIMKSPLGHQVMQLKN